MKIRYYDRKVRESLEIDVVEVRHKKDKVLSQSNGNFGKTNATNENTPLKFEVILF